ncbi:SMC-Scp complex subunit ScpB [Thalassotalea fonticola]|uniref:SMC-Scp complex subunit ScpB n=1 Tax=Thalassotalea fonticola TaxID=3065649 RepID=A0ABZ0GPM4_9GAMM|nr:SMC-Scp complex subunit ScpB [Colwelliaceae bacterium S1-1]
MQKNTILKQNDQDVKLLIEAMIFVSQVPLSVKTIQETLGDQIKLTKKRLLAILHELQNDYDARGISLIEVASGFRFQAKDQYSDYIALLFKEKAPRYSRALLETLSLIAYRQPITRGEIEDIRGVAVSSYIIRTLQERDWIHVVGHKEVPGKPGLFGTTKEFLDYFSLKSLSDLPELMEVAELKIAADGERAPVAEQAT